MIKTIIFDLAEVYLTGMKGVETLIELLNMPADVIEKQLHDENLSELFNGKITEDEYWKKIIVKNNWSIDAKLLKDAVRNNFKEIDGTRDIINELKQHGYELGLLSVHTKEWIEYCEKRFDYHGLFNEIMYSFEVAISKPYLEAYRLLLVKMNAIPSESLFIDDNIENINSARQLGINTVQFQDADQLRSELQKMNIL
jgi:HAD superfamily hydrolase (TIGR01509 family)